MSEPASRQPGVQPHPHDWPDLGALVRHIVATHHHFVRQALPALTAGLNELVNRHGASMPELHRARQILTQLGDELLVHMDKEEHILFPYITELAGAHTRAGRLPPNPFGTVANPVRMMEDDHQNALALMMELRALTGNYTAPPGWTASEAAAFASLARFEVDLRQHIDLENVVLFPGALDLEERLA